MTHNDSYPFEFSTDVPAATYEDNPLTVERDAPYDGRVTSVVIGWSDGCDNLVGVSFGTETGENFVPRNKEDQVIAANDFTHPFNVKVDVTEDDTLMATFVNNDSANSHFVNVFVTIEERYTES